MRILTGLHYAAMKAEITDETRYFYRMKCLLNSDRGFSLVELAIVVLIIAILSAVAIPVYQNNVEKAKRSEVMVTMAFVKDYLRIYKGIEGHYPIATIWENVVGSDWNDFPNGKLRGKYFLSKYYDYWCVDGEEYRVRCYWNEGRDANYWLDEQGRWSWEVPLDEW